MARVRATCSECGDVELSVGDVTVRFCTDGAEDGTYVFACPSCALEHEKPCGRQTLDLLVASGAELAVWSRPVERLLDDDLGALTHDELLDFHHSIHDDDSLAAALDQLAADHLR